jgi:hypothetical protein
MLTMRKAATIYLASAAAMACLALTTTTINCGGSSGERPSGTGGTSSAGGATNTGGAVGTGGTTTNPSSGLDCSAAVTPDNVTSGGVTDFTDWSSSAGRWGSSAGLHGAIYGYKDSSSPSMSVTVDSANLALHAVGGVAAGGYGGMGLGFQVCATVASFSQISFDVMGSSPGCDVELQIKTFDQQPTNQNPAGGCDSTASSCYNFPVVKQVVNLQTAIASFTNVTVPLSNFADGSGTAWPSNFATQVVGLQWQFTGTAIDPDAGTACPIDVSITNVKFLP